MKCSAIVLLLIGLAGFVQAADDLPMETTNALPLPQHGSLLAITPKNWTLVPFPNRDTNDAQQFELRSNARKTVVQLKVFWDGIGPVHAAPNDADMSKLLTDIAVKDYAPISVEKKGAIESVKGAEMHGIFVRFTDARWATNAPPAGEYANLTTGMFRCANLWGYFTLFTNDKDGPQFKLGMQVVETLKKAP